MTETYWGEPTTDDEKQLVVDAQNAALWLCVTTTM
jgi:hypothetical protein